MSIPKTHPFPFDPTYCMTLEQLRAIVPPPAPSGFDVFWAKRYERALAIDPQPRLTKSAFTHPAWHVLDITYRSSGDVEISGWLLLPRDKPVRRGVIVGHGYGGRDAPDFEQPVEETALLFPCFRGMSKSQHPPIPPDAPGHVLYDIDKPDQYVIGGCVDDLWLAVSTLLAVYPWLSGRIGYIGASFGGGVGALGIPFDPRIARGHLVVPTFGDRAQWLTLPTVGSADSVQTYRKTHPDVLDHLRLFDAATAATRITVPMLVAPALFDPAVAPPCQFAVANALPASKDNEIFVLDAGHFDYPGMMEQNYALREKLRGFLHLL